jgi:hypothetical protein
MSEEGAVDGTESPSVVLVDEFPGQSCDVGAGALILADHQIEIFTGFFAVTFFKLDLAELVEGIRSLGMLRVFTEKQRERLPRSF